MPYCTDCGNKTKPTDRFCSNCGKQTELILTEPDKNILPRYNHDRPSIIYRKQKDSRK